MSGQRNLKKPQPHSIGRLPVIVSYQWIPPKGKTADLGMFMINEVINII